MASLGQPLGNGPRQKILDGDAVAADQQRALDFEGRCKGGCTGVTIRRPAALHFDGRRTRTDLGDEIDFAATISPVLIDGSAKGVAHLGVGPMWQT